MAFHQVFRANCLRDWFAGPQGQRVLASLRRELESICPLRFGDTLLELAPVGLMDPESTRPAWTLQVGSEAAALHAEPEQLPLASGVFSCVLLTHSGAAPERAGAVVAEAARVLAPEGHLFLLGLAACPGQAVGGLRSAVPAGLRRRAYRRSLEQAGLGVHRQLTLSLLPATLPASWYRRLGRVDAVAAAWLPVLGTCVLTVARRRDVMPLSPRAARLGWSGPSVRAGGTSQWA